VYHRLISFVCPQVQAATETTAAGEERVGETEGEEIGERRQSVSSQKMVRY